MKKLLAIGDSFTHGDELSNPTVDAWPHLLADRMGYQAVNLSWPGSGNAKMVRRLFEQQIDEFDLVVIAWSGFDRIEFADQYGIFDTWPGAVIRSQRVPHKEAMFRAEIIEYITRHHDDDYLYKQYLVNVISAQSYLKLHKKKYIMLDAFLNNQGSMRSQHSELATQIDQTHFLGWPTESMMEWVEGAPKGPLGHFLKLGHSKVADRLHQHVVNTFKE